MRLPVTSRLRLLLALSPVMLLLLATAPALAKSTRIIACSCLPASFEKRIIDAERIYVATVRSIETVDKLRLPGNEDPPVIVTFDVQEGFKNTPGREEQLHTNLTRATCMGHPFEQGRTYLVYAYLRLPSSYETWSLYNFKTGTLDTGGLCGGTRDIAGNDATTAEEIRTLRTLKESGDSRLVPRKAKP